MTPKLRAHIPNRLLTEQNTAGLREWLRTRGTSMTLLELDQERRQRGLRPPLTKTTEPTRPGNTKENA